MRATPGIGAERLRQLLRDGLRRLAQRARELEGDRHREIAQRARSAAPRRRTPAPRRRRSCVRIASRRRRGPVVGGSESCTGRVSSRRERRAKLVIRLQFVTLKRLEPGVVGRRVHVCEQPIADRRTARMSSTGTIRVRTRVHEFPHLQRRSASRAAAGPGRRACRRRTTDDSRVRSAARQRRRRRRARTGTRRTRSSGTACRRPTRNSVSPRAAVSAACRPPSGPQPGTMSRRCDANGLAGLKPCATWRRRGAAAHDHHVVGQRRQRRQLAIADRAAVHDQRALVAAAEARRPAAGQNRALA